MEEEKEVKVQGSRLSLYCLMVELALKLKGVAYEYVEEDLQNKSAALLRHNPVHRKVPVLLHRRRPLAESLVILHYIDDTWPEPPLLPKDPYRRATVRFWVDFFYNTIAPACRAVIISQGEELGTALDALKAALATMEGGLEHDFAGEGPFFNGATPGLLDVVMGSSSFGVDAVEEVVGAKLVDVGSTPFMSSRLSAFGQLELARETLPSRPDYLEYARRVRETFLSPTKA